MCPGQKDCISIVNKGGKRQKIQKRMMLSNLKELHAAWKNQYPDKNISFSSFAGLRPKHCILAGVAGTHSVCVCKHHQNPKLMCQAVGLDYKDLIKLSVCDEEKEDCMMRQCKRCPGEEELLNFLQTHLLDEEEILYNQWLSTDRTTLFTVNENKSAFIEKLVKDIKNLSRHSFIAKAQSNYFKSLKENLTENQAIVNMDFSENYSFTVQDEIQSYHWEKNQCTIHPIVSYLKKDGKTISDCVCIISNHKNHTTTAVYSFLNVFIPYLKNLSASIEKIHYFTDGSAAQYKNKYNFVNLCHHTTDFDLQAEWNFFATSHGKSACDGIGGTVKRLTKKASLQRPTSNQILNIDSMFTFCEGNILGIKFFKILDEDVKVHEKNLADRFESAKTISGTRQFHRFVPVSHSNLKVFKMSSQKESPKLVSVSEILEESDESVEFKLSEHNFVCCLYDGNPYVGLVEEKSEEHGDVLINFMEPKCPSEQYNWPKKEDKCWVKKENIMFVVETPLLTSSSSRGYILTFQDSFQISKLLNSV